MLNYEFSCIIETGKFLIKDERWGKEGLQMKIIRKIFRAITAIILIPTVALVAFILIADAKDMDFKSKSEETQVVERAITVPGIFGLQNDDSTETEEIIETAESVEAEN